MQSAYRPTLALVFFGNETRPSAVGLDVRFWFQAMPFMLDCFLGSNCRRMSTPRAFKCGFRSIHLRPGESFKKNLGHHPFVLMLQEVTVEYRDAANDRVREIHDEIERFIGCEIDCIHPFRPAEGRSRPLVDKKMNLMDVKRMNLVC
jgi:hypothetical protein